MSTALPEILLASIVALRSSCTGAETAAVRIPVLPWKIAIITAVIVYSSQRRSFSGTGSGSRRRRNKHVVAPTYYARHTAHGFSLQ